MGIEALVQPAYPIIVGTPWLLDGHYGLHNGANVTIATITVAAKQGHRYRITVSATGYVRGETDKHRTFAAAAGTTDVVTQRVGFGRGGFAAALSFPIALIGLWTATADGSVDFKFNLTREDATEDDWELAEAKHHMFVEDLGP